MTWRRVPNSPPSESERWAGVDAMTADDYDQYREAQAEIEAEAAQERWLEEAGSRGDPAGYEYERMLMAQEDYR